MKATEQYFPVVLFITLYIVNLTFESVDEILKCHHQMKDTEQYFPVTVYYAEYYSTLGKWRIEMLIGKADNNRWFSPSNWWPHWNLRCEGMFRMTLSGCISPSFKNSSRRWTETWACGKFSQKTTKQSKHIKELAVRAFLVQYTWNFMSEINTGSKMASSNGLAIALLFVIHLLNTAQFSQLWIHNGCNYFGFVLSVNG